MIRGSKHLLNIGNKTKNNIKSIKTYNFFLNIQMLFLQHKIH